MISALDSSVILDVLVGSEAQAERSLDAVRRASLEGKLVVCESVIAEVRPVFSDRGQLEELMQDWGLEYAPSSRESAMLAGEMLTRFLWRKGERTGRILADFLIGAHARIHADRLVARDRGYLRDCFKDLVVLDPSAP
jgi:predicted nucleic acid-binding protein